MKTILFLIASLFTLACYSEDASVGLKDRYERRFEKRDYQSLILLSKIEMDSLEKEHRLDPASLARPIFYFLNVSNAEDHPFFGTLSGKINPNLPLRDYLRPIEDIRDWSKLSDEEKISFYVKFGKLVKRKGWLSGVLCTDSIQQGSTLLYRAAKEVYSLEMGDQVTEDDLNYGICLSYQMVLYNDSDLEKLFEKKFLNPKANISSSKKFELEYLRAIILLNKQPQEAVKVAKGLAEITTDNPLKNSVVARTLYQALFRNNQFKELDEKLSKVVSEELSEPDRERFHFYKMVSALVKNDKEGLREYLLKNLKSQEINLHGLLPFVTVWISAFALGESEILEQVQLKYNSKVSKIAPAPMKSVFDYLMNYKDTKARRRAMARVKKTFGNESMVLHALSFNQTEGSVE